LAVSGAAVAQSTVSIDGILDAGYQALDYKGTKVNGVANNGAATSQINFRGTEDLGGGLKATFRVETDWHTTSNRGNTGAGSTPVTGGDTTVAAASTFGNGEIRVGLNGGFGAVDLGAVNYNTLGTYLTGQPFGTAIGSGFRALAINDAQAVSAVRSDNSIKYVSPNFSGLTVSLYTAAKQTKAIATTANQSTSFSTSMGAFDMQGTNEIGVNYANGPIAASFSNLKQNYKDVGTGSTVSTVNTFGANYTMGAAKLFALYQTNETDTKSTDNKYMSVSASYAMGATTVMAQAGSLENKSGQKSDMTSLGANYALSKRTTVYARYENIDDKAGVVANPGSLTTVGSKRTRTGLGVIHTF
jgi:predicted porin